MIIYALCELQNEPYLCWPSIILRYYQHKADIDKALDAIVEEGEQEIIPVEIYDTEDNIILDLQDKYYIKEIEVL